MSEFLEEISMAKEQFLAHCKKLVCKYQKYPDGYTFTLKGDRQAAIAQALSMFEVDWAEAESADCSNSIFYWVRVQGDRGGLLIEECEIDEIVSNT